MRCPTGGVGRPLASKGGRPLHCSVGVLLHNDTVSASDAAIVGGAQVAKAAVRGACAEPVSGLPPHRMGTAVQSWSGEAAAAVPVQGSVVRGPRIRRLLGKPSGAASGAAARSQWYHMGQPFPRPGGLKLATCRQFADSSASAGSSATQRCRHGVSTMASRAALFGSVIAPTGGATASLLAERGSPASTQPAQPLNRRSRHNPCSHVRAVPVLPMGKDG